MKPPERTDAQLSKTASQLGSNALTGSMTPMCNRPVTPESISREAIAISNGIAEIRFNAVDLNKGCGF